MKASTFSTLLFFVLSACSQPKSIQNGKAGNLCAGLKQDLDYIHATVKKDFSGYAYSEEVRKKSDTVFKQVYESVPRCSSDLDYVRSVKRYFASFNDPHIHALWNGPGKIKPLIEATVQNPLPEVHFPIHYTATGILLARYGNKFFVKAIDAKLLGKNDVQVGDEFKDCDGKSPAEILNVDILPYESVSSKDAALYRFAQNIFYRWDIASDSTSSCRFERDGFEKLYKLNWQPVTEGYLSAFKKPSNSIYEIEKRPYGHWVRVKTFAGYSDEVNDQLKQFVSDAKSLRRDKIIVVDVRGNTGGNEAWGNSWIKDLFGYVNSYADSQPEFILASAKNFTYFQKLYAYLKTTGGITDAENNRVWTTLLQTMQAHPDELTKLPTAETKNKSKPISRFKGKVYVLTDSWVFSSAENFVQTLKEMPGTIQVGVSTDASTFNSDLRFDIAPSGLLFALSTKIVTGNFYKRASGDPLVPNISLFYDPKQEALGTDSLKNALERLLVKNK